MRIRDLFMQLISATQGRGASSTRLIYLASGLAAVFCAALMSIGGILEYCLHDKADPVYWTAVVALWTAKLGFGAHEKSEQQKTSKEIAVAPYHNTMATAVTVSGD